MYEIAIIMIVHCGYILKVQIIARRFIFKYLNIIPCWPLFRRYTFYAGPSYLAKPKIFKHLTQGHKINVDKGERI